MKPSFPTSELWRNFVAGLVYTAAHAALLVLSPLLIAAIWIATRAKNAHQHIANDA